VPFTPPNLGSRTTLYLHPNDCTYLFSVSFKATVTWNDNSHSTADAGTVVSGPHPLSDFDTALNGGGNIAGHSVAYIANSNLDADYFVADDITSIAGENAGGSAVVSWTFTPAP